MTTTGKLCDVADWFDPAIHDAITRDLRELPRFHRKQWEFAMILNALRNSGKLHSDSRGLSMGGGTERVLYAIAPSVRSLLVTDLYDQETTWDCARTDDPEAFVKSSKPFPVDDKNISVQRMDMRNMSLRSSSFDFCYSTCAVEHIGHHDDFLRHFNEVARVLNDDGLYVMTTEISHDDSLVKDSHNYIFSLEWLGTILAESDLEPVGVFDGSVTAHHMNNPLPSNLANLSFSHGSQPDKAVNVDSHHIHLLRGRHPFTCGLFLLQKKRRPNSQLRIVGNVETKQFMLDGVEAYSRSLKESVVSLNPFSLVAGEHSRFFVDHREFFNSHPDRSPDNETVFHTDYFWFDEGQRQFDIQLSPSEWHHGQSLNIRIHTYRTLESEHVECCKEIIVPVDENMSARIVVETDRESCYAVVAKQHGGTCEYKNISIRSRGIESGKVRPLENLTTQAIAG